MEGKCVKSCLQRVCGHLFLIVLLGVELLPAPVRRVQRRVDHVHRDVPRRAGPVMKTSYMGY